MDSTDGTYSAKVGLLFVFNLIVGTGALALPKSFQVAGYVSSVVLIHISAFTSFVCAAFVIECMAIANAALTLKQNSPGDGTITDANTNTVVVNSGSNNSAYHNPYNIKYRTEVTEMSRLFMNRACLFFTYLLLVLYLFGDLTIYCTTVSKSILNIICSPVNVTDVEGNVHCLFSSSMEYKRGTVYTSIVMLFALFITPLVWIGVSRTKHLQICTSASRWTAFILMTTIASIKLIKTGAEGSPKAAELSGFGSLFGTTVYAFMCHHSLPGLITPIRNKHRILRGIATVYIAILLFYVALSLTGSYAFAKVMDVYTLNFLEFHSMDSVLYKMMDYFLALFPVFTLSTNYPIVANTLANNLCVVIDMFMGKKQRTTNEEEQSLLNSENITAETFGRQLTYSSRTVKNFCLLMVILFPMGISLITDNVLLLASITGSYPGVGVQYIIPSLLILYARRYKQQEFDEITAEQTTGIFQSMLWPFGMLTWSLFAIVMVTLNLLKAF